MADPEIENLTKRATQLRSLADHIDSLVTKPKTHSTTQMKKWAGPNADKVRGDLNSWHTKCTTVATKLREMATQCDKSAENARKPKDK
ncbi:WXG100 family type VII secretion target [Streptomyces sp. 796.1]|uniref:WXG100 family type VII secretion target n=1 Tax=Streptomyces sp. 796.1 TaxID=3163029 RepID=UPI0039C956EB